MLYCTVEECIMKDSCSYFMPTQFLQRLAEMTAVPRDIKDLSTKKDKRTGCDYYRKKL